MYLLLNMTIFSILNFWVVYKRTQQPTIERWKPNGKEPQQPWLPAMPSCTGLGSFWVSSNGCGCTLCCFLVRTLPMRGVFPTEFLRSVTTFELMSWCMCLTFRFLRLEGSFHKGNIYMTKKRSDEQVPCFFGIGWVFSVEDVGKRQIQGLSPFGERERERPLRCFFGGDSAEVQDTKKKLMHTRFANRIDKQINHHHHHHHHHQQQQHQQL